MVFIIGILAGISAVTQADCDFLYGGQIYAAIAEQSERDVPLAPPIGLARMGLWVFDREALAGSILKSYIHQMLGV